MKPLRFLPPVLALLSLGCPPKQPPDEPGPTPAPTTTTVPDGMTPEEAACRKLEELQCKSRDGRNLWEPTAEGKSCVDVFLNAAQNGINMNAGCIANITSCDQRNSCTPR